MTHRYRKFQQKVEPTYTSRVVSNYIKLAKKQGRAEALAEVNKILDKWYMRLWKMSKNPSANYFDDLKLEIKSLVEEK